MQLKRVYVRFYKSFNFDYERRARAQAARHEWEQLGEGWYPHVRLDLEPDVTAVVGANESGKSHLLDAIECVVGTRAVERSDFCRHSQMYSIETNEVRLPDVGADFLPTQESQVETLATLGIECPLGETFLFMRPGVGEPFAIYGDEIIELDSPAVRNLEAILPSVLRFSTDIAIPDSVPIVRLWGGQTNTLSDRRERSRFLEFAGEIKADDASEFNPYIPQFIPFFSRRKAAARSLEDERRDKEYELAEKLLVSVAGVDRQIFKDLQHAISEGDEGDVSGLTNKINQALGRRLNFSRWWSQDADFALRVAPRERELVFTIQDRTETEYSFKERSKGLTHFLAYFVQLRAHVRDTDRAEILLMDEPDAYLSNSGQQDLLRVLENFSSPDDGARQDQVVYVTHSPFLINRNAAHRLRVLDKGAQEEGTRVVKDVGRTHYEPLRSALGGHVAETTFIGGKNLIVEGVADQVLLAGLSSAFRRRGADPDEVLDLNEVTIVPAGSASSVPYIAYLARGRDPIKPPCVALLDGDEAGKDAAKKLWRSELNRKPILAQEYIVQIDEWALRELGSIEPARPSGIVIELEDLVPTRVAVAAARGYAKHLLAVPEESLDQLKEAALRERLAAADTPLWDALSEEFSASFDGEHIDKIGFAREVVAYVGEIERGGARPPGVPALEKNFTQILHTLAELLDGAEAEESERRRNRRMGRIVRSFLDDYSEGSNRSTADARLKEIEATLDDIAAHDPVRQRILAIRRDFNLRKDPLKQVDRFSDFADKLRSLLVSERLDSQGVVE